MPAGSSMPLFLACVFIVVFIQNRGEFVCNSQSLFVALLTSACPRTDVGTCLSASG